MSQSRRYKFPAQNRIKKRTDFVALRTHGRRLRTPHFYIQIIVKNEGLRLGVTVTKRIGNAVERNRVKRLVREFFRLNFDRLPSAADISVVARRDAASLNLAAVTEELKLLCGLTSDQGFYD